MNSAFVLLAVALVASTVSAQGSFLPLLTLRTVHFGGSLSDTQEVVYLEQETADFACASAFPTPGFTQTIFGRAAIPLFVDQNQFGNPFQVGPVGLPSTLQGLFAYRIQLARYQANILPQYNAGFPGISVPVLSQQIDSFVSLISVSGNEKCDNGVFEPTFFSIALGANDLSVIFEVGVAQLEAGAPLANVEAFFANAVSGLFSDTTHGLVSQISRLAKISPSAVILVTNVPDLTKTPKFSGALPASVVPLFQGLIVSYNNALAQVASSFPNVKIFDLFSFLDAQIASAPVAFQSQACLSTCTNSPQCVFADPYSSSTYVNVAAAKAIAQLLSPPQQW